MTDVEAVKAWMRPRMGKYKSGNTYQITQAVTDWAFEHNCLYSVQDWDHPVWDAAVHFAPEFRKLKERSDSNTNKIIFEMKKAKSKNKKRKNLSPSV